VNRYFITARSQSFSILTDPGPRGHFVTINSEQTFHCAATKSGGEKALHSRYNSILDAQIFQLVSIQPLSIPCYFIPVVTEKAKIITIASGKKIDFNS
jgi:hypothetical protein